MASLISADFEKVRQESGVSQFKKKHIINKVGNLEK